jgi:hypothetical protein
MTGIKSEPTPPTDQGTSPAKPAARKGPGRSAAAVRPGRLVTVVVLLAGLAVSVIARSWAMALQDTAAASGPYSTGEPEDTTGASRSSSFGNMDSFALALLLGGLRGPLVMFLWVSSESQKNEKDLEDFDTKIDWIRRLQPEFDTVHIFQMWNKAYNVSVQLSSLPDRYSAILDALEYGKAMDQTRPNDMNILLAIDQIYGNKLGSTNGDKTYYIREVRLGTMSPANARAARHSVAPRHQLPPMLDNAGNLLPELVTPNPRYHIDDQMIRVSVPARQVPEFEQAAARAGVAVNAANTTISNTDSSIISPGDHVVTISESDAGKIEAAGGDLPGVLYIRYADQNDGSELQYLRRYQPYPYGLSPIALGYNYGKRAQVLMAEGRQKPVQMGASVVDSKPATELRQWAEDEWERAADSEMEAYGRALAPEVANAGPGTGPQTRGQKEAATKDIRIEEPPAQSQGARDAVASALYSYALTAQLCRDSRAEYVRHLSSSGENYVNRFQDYASTIDSLKAEEALVSGDHDFLLAATLPPGPARHKLMMSSLGQYRDAVLGYKYLLMRYYMPAEVLEPLLKPLGYTRTTLHQYLLNDPKAFNAFFEKMSQRVNLLGVSDPNASERNDYLFYIDRAAAREASLTASLAALGGDMAMPPRATTGPASMP